MIFDSYVSLTEGKSYSNKYEKKLIVMPIAVGMRKPVILPLSSEHPLVRAHVGL